MQLRPHYVTRDNQNVFVGFYFQRHVAHSNRMQPVTPVKRYPELMRTMDEVALVDARAIEEYVRTGGGPLQQRMDAIDQRMGRAKG